MMNHSVNPLRPDFRLGFIGGGQLARMSAYSAFRFGMQVVGYTGTGVPEPLSFSTPHIEKGGLNDPAALLRFAGACDLITLENEFIDADVLLRVRDESGIPIYPSPETFRLISDKITEKETFSRAGIPVVPFSRIADPAGIATFAGEHGWPVILKSSKGGYDGYGNITVNNSTECEAAFRQLGGHEGRELLAEAFIPFTKELAVMVARNHLGICVYPCVETIQENHICRTVIAPAPIDPELRRHACGLAVAATEAIDGTGVFGFEFFLTDSGDILLNESAPRPHNSGHYTMEACVTSQFENHVRTVTGLHPGSSEMRRPAAVMVNLLGLANGKTITRNTADLMQTPDAHLHIYGKLLSKSGRKMGHITLLGDDINETLTRAEKLARQIVL
jgi:5-(carboxyamino)imidazole ribonucleotide synthase